MGSNNPTVLQTSGNYTLANNIVLNSSAQFTTLQVGGANNFSLSGVISGGSATNRSGLMKIDTNTLTLAGANTFSGPLEVVSGLLQIINDAGTGLAPLHLTGGNATFTTASPTVYGLEGAAGTTLTLAANSTLTLNTADESYEYLGNIVSSGAGAALVITGGGDQQFEGTNTGISGTTVLNGAIIAHTNQAFGSGAITLNATGESAKAGLGVVQGVTLTNAINFTSGIIIGFGTLTPSNGPLQVGANRTLSPGAGRADFAPGKLSFGNGLGFNSGGTYEWMVTDAHVTTGLYGTIDVTGALTISATAGSPFILTLSTNDGNGNAAWASNFNSGLAYTWTILSATGGITGFSADRFSLTSTGFQNHLGGGSFSLSADTNHLFLNFAPIPEPGVTSLMLIGIGALGLRGWRKRRRNDRDKTAA